MNNRRAFLYNRTWEDNKMCGCLLLPLKLVFVVVKLVLCLVLFIAGIFLLPFLLLAGALCLFKSLFS